MRQRGRQRVKGHQFIQEEFKVQKNKNIHHHWQMNSALSWSKLAYGPRCCIQLLYMNFSWWSRGAAEASCCLKTWGCWGWVEEKNMCRMSLGLWLWGMQGPHYPTMSNEPAQTPQKHSRLLPCGSVFAYSKSLYIHICMYIWRYIFYTTKGCFLTQVAVFVFFVLGIKNPAVRRWPVLTGHS